MRFAIWKAVSTIAQADDEKESLPNQEIKCRTVASAKAWIETAGPFTVPGESRTRWINLRDAEEEIPQLRQMLESAKAGKFDILVMYDYNRLRDLLDPVAKALTSYGVQIYSINQPVEPINPKDFDPSSTDSESMMRGMSQIISRWQIADLRRKFFYGVAARAKKGLPAIRIPYGYMRPPGRELDKNAIPIPNPVQVAVILEIKKLFMSGTSTGKIADILTRRGIPSPAGKNLWRRNTVEKILRNKFYAGKVFFMSEKYVTDARNKTTKRRRNPNEIVYEGKHQGIYSWEEYLAIQEELKRRESAPTSSRYMLSGLMKCSVCGKRLYHRDGYWRCRNPKGQAGDYKDHIGLRTVEANYIISHALKNEVLKFKQNGGKFQPKTDNNNQPITIETLQAERKKVQTRLERGIYTLDEAEEKINGINAQISALQNEETKKARQKGEYVQFLEAMDTLSRIAENIPETFRKGDPQIIHSLLYRLCKEIIISPNREVRIVYKDGA